MHSHRLDADVNGFLKLQDHMMATQQPEANRDTDSRHVDISLKLGTIAVSGGGKPSISTQPGVKAPDAARPGAHDAAASVALFHQRTEVDSEWYISTA